MVNKRGYRVSEDKKFIEQVAVFRTVPSRKTIWLDVFCVAAPAVLTFWWMQLTPLESIDVWLIVISAFLSGTSFMGLIHGLSLRKHHAKAKAREAEKAHEEADAADEDDDEYSTF